MFSLDRVSQFSFLKSNRPWAREPVGTSTRLRQIEQFSATKGDALFVWLISHQPAVLFSHNKPVSSTFLSEQISTSHQPNEQAENSYPAFNS
jgi:hypothetical protein